MKKKIFCDKNAKAFDVLKRIIRERYVKQVYFHPDENKKWRVNNTIQALHTRKVSQKSMFSQLNRLSDNFKSQDNKKMINKVVQATRLDQVNVTHIYNPLDALQ
jgi:hypothetical protein